VDHEPSRAPDRGAVELVPPPLPDVPPVAVELALLLRAIERGDRRREHPGDLTVDGAERRRAMHHADERRDQDPADERVDGRERTHHLGHRGVEPDLLARLAQRGGAQVGVARFDEPTRERDFARMTAKMPGALGEHERRVRSLDEQAQDGGESIVRGGLGTWILIERGAQRAPHVERGAGFHTGIVGDPCRNAPGRVAPVSDEADRTAADALANVRSPAADAVAAAVDPDSLLGFARALIAAPSENPGGTEDGAAEVAAGILNELGSAPETVRDDAGRPSVVASLGGPGRPHLAWNGHLDTVPAGALDTWSRPPFAGEVVDGRLVGRGACDMKGPIAAALAAATAVRRAGVELGGSLVFHLAADEELAGTHGTKVLWERGLLDQDAAIVGEPSDLRVGLAERGGAWLTATAFGTAAHGSQPHRGVNAITSMARFLLRLEEGLPDLEHPLVGRPTVNAALIAGGSAPNVVPDRCEVDIDRRIIPGETDPEAVVAPFRAIAEDLRRNHPEVRIEVEVREWTDAAEAPSDSAIAALATAAVHAETGSPPAPVGFTGITDARFYINEARIPTAILGPGSLSVAHTADEWVGVDDLVRAARVYARLFVGFLGGA
jgi:succinyl-diaminopimelate desuccinylase